MSKKYSQTKAMLAIMKASLRAAFRSPQGVFFSLFFPIVLIVIFGSLGRNSGVSVDVAFDQQTDSTNVIYQKITRNGLFDIKKGSAEHINDLLKKGRITAKIRIVPVKNSDSAEYEIHLITSSAGMRDYQVLRTALENVIQEVDAEIYPARPSAAFISNEMIKGRAYSQIDFLLPGMIGFSLIGAAIFGIAFSFYSLKETLVLKRLYSTPIRKPYIVLGEGIARVIFQLTTVVALIAFGYFAYNFTLANGFITFLEMMLLSFLGLIVFMGFGFVISGISKNQNVIPIYANLFMFPQYFLSGTFFPKTALPLGLQSVINYLPLTASNDAMRNVAFEGTGLLSCWKEISILIIWGIIVYSIAVRVFKWE
jgi:ABC-2 type transport system permease protein